MKTGPTWPGFHDAFLLTASTTSSVACPTTLRGNQSLFLGIHCRKAAFDCTSTCCHITEYVIDAFNHKIDLHAHCSKAK